MAVSKYAPTVNKKYSNVITKVLRIIYYNQASKWGVLSCKNTIKDNLFMEPTITVVGNFVGVYENCKVELNGNYKVNSNYGGQLELTSIKVLKDLASAESIINFLVKSGIQGISTQNAVKIYEKFGAKSIDVVLNKPEKLTEIYGIGTETYNKVVKSIQEYKTMQELIKYGCKLGMPYNLLFKLNASLGEKAVEALKGNIYEIVELSDAFSFKQLDIIGQKAGIPPTDPKRLRACLIDKLRNKVMLDSSTGCNSADVRTDFAKASGLSELKYYNTAMAMLRKENFVVIEGAKVYYKPYYNKEKFIAKVLLDLMEVPLSANSVPDMLHVAEAMAEFDFELNEQQKNAIEGLVQERVAVLTGGPGTGKTTITKALVSAFKKAHVPFRLLTPTGKATRRLEECTGEKASTIHKYLKVFGEVEDATVVAEPKDTVFIIDESSMVDILLLAKICEIALLNPIRIIFVGDANQLPSVQAGNVLGDLINSKVIPSYVLTDIMRQAKDSNIIKYCADINEGRVIQRCVHKDFVYRIYEDDGELLNDLMDEYSEAVKKYGLLDVQIIAPFKEGTLGIKTLNEELGGYINNKVINDKFGYRVGDKVMQTVNDYSKDVFNGEVGIVEAFDNDHMYIKFAVNSERTQTLTQYKAEESNFVQMAYAATCHKSQGAEYPAVFVILEDKYRGLLLNRKLLYTAVSRGKKEVHIYSMGRTLEHCITNTYEKPRVTKLKSFLIGEQ